MGDARLHAGRRVVTQRELNRQLRSRPVTGCSLRSVNEFDGCRVGAKRTAAGATVGIRNYGTRIGMFSYKNDMSTLFEIDNVE